MFNNQSIIEILTVVPPVLLGLTVHEYAHARTALAFGDDTALRQGRVSLNPLVHLDVVGTLCLIFAHFGWAKPVMVNKANLHPPRLGDIMVSLAGPLSNLLMAIAFCLLFRLAAVVPLGDSPVRDTVLKMLLAGISINVVLFVFNLIPLYPLDGHHILRNQLPLVQQPGFMQWQMKFGQPLLMALVLIPRFVDVPIDPIGMAYNWSMYAVVHLLL